MAGLPGAEFRGEYGRGGPGDKPGCLIMLGVFVLLLIVEFDKSPVMNSIALIFIATVSIWALLKK